VWSDIVAGTWLEVSFGWKPLVKDTQDLAETIARFTLPDQRRTRVRAFVPGLLGSEINGFASDFAGSTAVGAMVDFRTETTGGIQFICGLRTDGSGPTNQLDRLRSLSGITLENFVPTIWELLPFSFLVDYFVNVGDILNAAFTQTTGVTWKMKTRVLKTTRTIVQDPFFAQPSPPWVVKSFSGKRATTTAVMSSVERIPIVESLGIPDRVMSTPWGNMNRSWNIVALANGFRSNHHPSSITRLR
jgi:hypothetical protein